MTDPTHTAIATKAPRAKLGRGLGALLGEMRGDAPLSPPQNAVDGDIPGKSKGVTTEGSFRSIPIVDISPLPGQPRTRFTDDALDELAASIRARGVIQPIIVRPLAEGRYQLVAGERRWRAAQRAQLHAIPAIVRHLEEREILALALIENLQREDLNPVEEARAYRQLAERENMTQADIATMIDKSRSHVANMQRLLELPNEVLDMLENARISMGHARALIGCGDAIALAQKAVDQRLSVREVERLVKGGRPAPARADIAPSANDNADIAAVQGHLEDFLGMPVRIATDGNAQRGTVTIRYRTLDQLDLICQRLTGGDI